MPKKKRKPSGPAPMDLASPLPVRLTPDQHAALSKAARQLRLSRAETLRRFLPYSSDTYMSSIEA